KGGRIAFLVNEEGKSVLHIEEEAWWNPAPTTARPARPVHGPVAGIPLGVISHVEFARDASKLANVFDGPRHNSDVWVITDTEKPRQLTHSSRAGIPLSQFVEPELIHYETFDQRKIPAWFYRPAIKPDQLPPVIVYPHGGPESQTRPNFNAIFQYFIQA